VLLSSNERKIFYNWNIILQIGGGNYKMKQLQEGRFCFFAWLRLQKYIAIKLKNSDRKILIMEERPLKNVNNCLNTDIYSYLATPGG
jgi:hypothetical protein